MMTLTLDTVFSSIPSEHAQEGQAQEPKGQEPKGTGEPNKSAVTPLEEKGHHTGETPIHKGIPFDQGLKALEKIVLELENGELPLDKALDLYEKGVGLLEGCQQHLKKAELRIQRIKTPLESSDNF